MMTDDYQAE